MHGDDSSSPSADQAPVRVQSLELKGSGGETAKVCLSDGSSFLVPGEVLSRERIAPGDRLDESRISSIKAQSERLFARARALSLLARGSHTRRGLADKLRKRGFGAEAVAGALARMIELGYLDDKAFAESWARSRICSTRDGFKALYRGLLRRGVPRKIAESVAADICTDEAEAENARRIASGLSPRSAVKKLTSRGFRARTIALVLKELRDQNAADPEE